ncbi:uncharacterized protein RSE6_03491 [Rhynchosporium secalis]|uniref:Peptidase A1 domain-containing protein n=1 Tax=Rhynchosporium secalis TaxID=38038 RepID=A0A1E1M2X0_RHYSE|nr:uncharacterized protein RSE6_03491 [Rhynchosporium secalis]
MFLPFLYLVCILLLQILPILASPFWNGKDDILAPRTSGDSSGFSVHAILGPASNSSAKTIRRGDGIWFAADTDYEWNIPIQAGTPPQTILVQPDTGTPDFSLMSTLIPVSSRGVAPGYGDGSIFFTGVVFRDTITVGGLTVHNYEFEVCETSKSQVGGAPYSTFGLKIDPAGMPTQPHRIPSFFPTVMAWLDDPVFAVDFHKSTSRGVFGFGHVDRKKYVGEISYTPVMADNGGEWVVSISGIVVGGTFIKGSFNVIIDTGNRYGFEIPRWALDRYFGQIPDTSSNSYWTTYTFPCDYPLPDLVLGVGDTGSVRIPGFIIETFKEDEKANLCRTNLHEGGGWGKHIVELLFVGFDYGNKRVGLAQKSSY